MRVISEAGMNQLLMSHGGEPLVVVEIFWDGINSTFYCDRGAFQDLPQVKGKIIELGGLEDVVTLNGSASTQSLTIKLDDIDNSIKNIYDVVDIHKRLVNVYQWFTQISFDDKFIIFEGYINSPIVWSEKERTFSFEIISKVEDHEIGFSAEEGDFPTLPDDLIGKPWPLPFGTPLKVPALRLDIVSHGIIMDSFGLHDPTLDAQLFNLLQQESVAGSIRQTKSLQAADVLIKTSADATNAFSLAQEALDSSHYITMVQDQQALDQITIDIAGNPTPSLDQLAQLQAAQDKIVADQAAADAADAANQQTLQNALKAAQAANLAVANQLLSQGADQQATIDKDKAKVSKQLAQELSFETKSIVIFNGHTYPQNQTATFQAGDLIITGTMSARNNSDGRGDSVFNIQKVARKKWLTYSYTGGQFGLYNFYGNLEIDREPTPVQITVNGGSFEFIKAGTALKWLSPLPTRYIAAMLPCTVLGVYAIRDFDQTKLLTAVPSGGIDDTFGNITAATPFGEVFGTNPFIGVNTALAGFKAGDNILTPGTGLPNNHYYDVSIEQFGDYDAGPFLATMITLVRPLTYWDEGWEDTIYVDLVSPIGPNTVDIITWFIQTYTKFGIDATSFATVRAQLANFASDFCLFERKNVVQILGEIAYQARCAIWLKNRVFYLRYLVPEPTPVDTITLDDIVFGSLEIDHTSTESLVTRLTADYRIDYGPLRDSEKGSGVDKIILRNNVAKYLLHEQTYNWYSYTNPPMVDLAATFWMIRKSNTWKQIKFKTPLHKLKLETFDPVAITIPWVCNGTITGLVEATHFNSDTMEIEFVVWMPVRIGEMTQFSFAWPDNTLLWQPTIVAVDGSPGPGIQARGDITSTRPSGGTTFPLNKGFRRALDSGNPTPGMTEAPPPEPRPFNPPIGSLDPRTDPGFTQVQQTPPDPITGLPPVSPLVPPTATTPQAIAATTTVMTFPAQIVSKTKPKDSGPDGDYLLKAFTQGITKPFTQLTGTDATFNATTNPGELTVDTWVMVSQISWTTGDVNAATAAAIAYAAAQVAVQQALQVAAQAQALAVASPTNDNKSAAQAATQAIQPLIDAQKVAGDAFLAARVTTEKAYYFVPGTPSASTFPGKVISGSGKGPYVCDLYMNGINGVATRINFVNQLDITDDSVPPDTWALIARGTKVAAASGDKSPGGPGSSQEFTMQVATWLT